MLRYFTFLLLVFACGCAHTISVKTKPIDGFPFIIIRGHHINSIDRIAIWSITNSEHYWIIKDISRSNNKSLRIKYGTLPAEMRQIVPSGNGLPKVPEQGEQVIIAISYQYDTYFPPLPSGSAKYFLCHIEESGKWTPAVNIRMALEENIRMTEDLAHILMSSP